MPFNLQDYEPVEDRLRAFWTEHPSGRITTELVHAGDDGYIVKASVWRLANYSKTTPEGTVLDLIGPDSTGYAQEAVTQRGVNATSALENCETSAIGRALANLGYAAKGKRPSREEMSKTSPPSGDRVVPSTPLPGDSAAQGTAADGVQAVPTPVVASSDAAASGEGEPSTGDDRVRGRRGDTEESITLPAPQGVDPEQRATDEQWNRLLAMPKIGGSMQKAVNLINRVNATNYTRATAQEGATWAEVVAAIAKDAAA